MAFAHAIVIGTGGVANFCANELQKRGVSVSFIESRPDGVGTSEAICRRKGVPYECLGKESLTARLLATEDDTLVVSASNRYLFPEQVLAKPNLLVVNYHGALLPKYPGRNAEAWAIFNCESEGGITWHKVVKDVDAGEILIQKAVPIRENTTSFSLLREYAKSAQQGFAEIIDGVLSGNYRTTKQVGERGEIMYSWMKPNDGILDLSWSGRKISAFLRAFDYGPLRTLGFPVVRWDGCEFEIDGYAPPPPLIQAKVVEEEKGKLCFTKDNYSFILYVRPPNEDGTDNSGAVCGDCGAIQSTGSYCK